MFFKIQKREKIVFVIDFQTKYKSLMTK